MLVVVRDDNLRTFPDRICFVGTCGTGNSGHSEFNNPPMAKIKGHTPNVLPSMKDIISNSKIVQNGKRRKTIREVNAPGSAER